MLSKYLKDIGLKGRRIFSLPGAPRCFRPTQPITRRVRCPSNLATKRKEKKKSAAEGQMEQTSATGILQPASAV
jgi:hypothetical protein